MFSTFARFFKRYTSTLIKVVSTPNCNSMKFSSPKLSDLLQKLQKTSSEFLSPKDALNDSLASSIFSLPDIKTIYYGNEFITVEKTPQGTWEDLSVKISNIISLHLNDKVKKQEPIISTNLKEDYIPSDDSSLLDQVKAIIEARIRPVIQDDGGDVSLCAIKEGRVYLKLRGACRSCSFSSDTLKHGIENMLKHYIDGINAVVQVDDDLEKFSEAAFDQFEASKK